MRMKAKKHFYEVYRAKKDKWLVEDMLDDAKRAIEKNQADSAKEREGWVKENSKLALARDVVLREKGELETRLKKAK